jgi:TPR repeat protein
VPKDLVEAARWLAASARAGNVDGEVEYAIALYNGTGVQRDEAGAATLLRKAARQGSPIAQNRLARILATGKGLPADAAAATKWHLVAKAGGAGDPWLDSFVQGLKPSDREAGEKAAKAWLDALQPPRS